MSVTYVPVKVAEYCNNPNIAPGPMFYYGNIVLKIERFGFWIFKRYRITFLNGTLGRPTFDSTVVKGRETLFSRVDPVVWHIPNPKVNLD